MAGQQKSPPLRRAFVLKPGNFLLSHTLTRAVPSGLRGLTSVFGMGTGGSLSLWSPRTGFDLNIDGLRSESSATSLQRSRWERLVMCAVNFMVKPNGQLVTVSSTGHPAYTSVLSNWSSSSALLTFRLGDLILGKVSRLYAFSVYPDRTSLPSDAAGATTGSQEVRSSRSSRTKDKPPQISYAHHR